MSFTIYDAAHSFTKHIKSPLAVNAKTSIFHNEDNFKYELRGKKTLVREADAPKPGTYNPDKGFLESYGHGGGLTWREFEPQFDRSVIIKVDKVDELSSYLDDMEPSIAALMDDYVVSKFAPEFDAANIATLCSRIPEDNVFTTGAEGFKVDVDNILQTITKIDGQMFNAGSDGAGVFYLHTDVYDAFRAALMKQNGAWAFTKAVRDVRIETGFEEIVGLEAPMVVQTHVIKLDNHYIVRMPENRMNSLITLLDGQSTGQEEGGYIPGGANNRVLRILAIPLKAAYVSVRYEVNNLLIPGSMRQLGVSDTDITRALQKMREGDNGRGMFSNATVQNIAFNPYFDRFEFHSRIIYGADIFNSRRKVCFAVADAPEE